AGARFGEDAPLLPALARLHANQALHGATRRALFDRKTPIREEDRLGLQPAVVVEVDGEASAEAGLRAVTIARRERDGREERTGFITRRVVLLRAGRTARHEQAHDDCGEG